MSLIRGQAGPWEVVLGLEVHAQVVSKAKLFSGAATDFGAEPNTQVSFVDAAMPGMLPVINEFCVEQAVKTGLGLAAEINLVSVFDRKNYFYADLPAGYQISQYQRPIVGKGKITLDLPEGKTRVVGITRLHLEQDAGKSLHDQHPTLTYVDLNRSGVALMEIVSEPDMRSAEEAAAYLRKLRSILRYLGTCDGNMEEGSLRCDVNVSVRRPGAPLGTRCEIKNVNSIRFVQQAIEYEARRQIAILEDGGTIAQETRLYDAGRGETRSMRSKEHAHDYRYFPDPDLLPLELDPEWVDRIGATMPELPDAKKARFITKYSLSEYQAQILVAEREIANAFEELVRKDLKRKLGQEKTDSIFKIIIDPSQSISTSPYVVDVEASATSSATLILGDVFAYSNESGEPVPSLVSRLDLVGLLQAIDEDVISGRIAKIVFVEMTKTENTAADIIEEKGLRQVTDTGAIEAAIAGVMADQADKVAEYRSGKEKLFGYFVGQVMKATGGKANPALLNELLRKKLAG